LERIVSNAREPRERGELGNLKMKEDKTVIEFKRELKNLLDKHEVKLVLSCEDMTAVLSIDTNRSVGNEICSQAESMHDETVVNDYLNSNARESSRATA
jgi:hypothetical protein